MKVGKAYAMAGIAILIWGASAALSKLILGELNSMQTLFGSSLVAAVVLFAIDWATGRLKQAKTYSRRDYAIMITTGFFGGYFYFLCYFSGLERLPAQQAMLINYLWPAATVMLAVIFFRERLTWPSLVAIGCSLAGVWLVSSQGESAAQGTDPTGILFCLGAAASYGVFNNLTRMKHYDLPFCMLVYMTFSALLSGACLAVSGDFFALTPAVALNLLWQGGFTLCAAYLCWGMAVRMGNVFVVSNLAYLTPGVSLVFIYLLLGEKIQPRSLAGMFVILLGVGIQVLAARPPKEPQ